MAMDGNELTAKKFNFFIANWKKSAAELKNDLIFLVVLFTFLSVCLLYAHVHFV